MGRHLRKPKQALADLHALGHERWALLWRGTLTLLEREEPRAYRRVIAALEHHELAGPAITLMAVNEAQSEMTEPRRLLRYSENREPSSLVTDDLHELPAPLVDAIMRRVRAFATDPYLGRLQGKRRAKKVTERELLLAYRAARWKIQRDAQAGRRRVRGAEALAELAHAEVASHYGLTAESVRSFLQDARRIVPAKIKDFLALLSGEVAWALTLGAGARPPQRGLKK